MRSWIERFPLTRPYTTAARTIDHVDNLIVGLESDAGLVGLGAASPEPHVTGETLEACGAGLVPAELDWLVGQDLYRVNAMARELRCRLPHMPAARAAVDIALHDLFAQSIGRPLVEWLGRCHSGLATSVTVGIMPTEDAVAEAKEHARRGFRALKVKVGLCLEDDLERLGRIREAVGPGVSLRADANQGYDVAQTLRFLEATEDLGLELLEQPLPAADWRQLARLPESCRRQIAVDESLIDEASALELLRQVPVACRVWNIKLMKAGGVYGGVRLAAYAEAGGFDLMWGCTDESRVSIAAALHVGLASPRTRYLDLDGSFDLARDIVDGGFILADGVLLTTEAPGLGVRLRPSS